MNEPLDEKQNKPGGVCGDEDEDADDTDDVEGMYLEMSSDAVDASVGRTGSLRGSLNSINVPHTTSITKIPMATSMVMACHESTCLAASL